MCDLCFSPNPSAYVELRHNVGMIFMRRTYMTAGELCGECLGKAMWKHQVSNLVFGWWGTISFFMTGYYLFDNFTVYFRAKRELDAAAARPGRAAAVLVGEPADRLAPFANNVRMRLRSGDEPEVVAIDLARTHTVPIEDAERFVLNLLDASPRDPARGVASDAV